MSQENSVISNCKQVVISSYCVRQAQQLNPDINMFLGKKTNAFEFSLKKWLSLNLENLEKIQEWYGYQGYMQYLITVRYVTKNSSKN